DADDLLRSRESGAPMPSLTIRTGGWHLESEAHPQSVENRGNPYDRLIGFGPAIGGFSNVRQQLRRTLEAKRGRYGDLDAPLVLAVALASPSHSDDEVFEVLYGTEAVQLDTATGATTPIRRS